MMKEGPVEVTEEGDRVVDQKAETDIEIRTEEIVGRHGYLFSLYCV